MGVLGNFNMLSPLKANNLKRIEMFLVAKLCHITQKQNKNAFKCLKERRWNENENQAE